jgi:hypothetical protein
MVHAALMFANDFWVATAKGILIGCIEQWLIGSILTVMIVPALKLAKWMER